MSLVSAVQFIYLTAVLILASLKFSFCGKSSNYFDGIPS